MTRISTGLKFVFLWLTVLCPLLVCAEVDSLPKVPTLIYQINIQSEINPGIARQVTKALAEAKNKKADRILIHMNTYGGLLDAADSIRTQMLNSKIPVTVFVDNNAASAGALIAIACNKIYMREGASIGAATVVNEKAEAMPDKYQSYMRSMMRSTAQARGRNPIIAEAMVDPRTYIEGVNDSGKVLTMTTAEAQKQGYCDGIAESVKEVISAEGITNYTISEYEVSWTDKLIGFLINPAVSGVLILVMLGGLYFELQHPGIGFPLFASITAALLYFAPLYIEGLAENWEVLISIVGIILIILEIFVIPGFGIIGISGILLLLFGLTTSMLNNRGFDFSGVSVQQTFSALAVVLLSMVGALTLFIFSSKVFSNSPAFKKMVLHESMNSSHGFKVTSLDAIIIGEKGIAHSTLRPSGKVEINGRILSATAESGFIEIGKPVEVTGLQSSAMVVVKELI